MCWDTKIKCRKKIHFWWDEQKDWGRGIVFCIASSESAETIFPNLIFWWNEGEGVSKGEYIRTNWEEEESVGKCGIAINKAAVRSGCLNWHREVRSPAGSSPGFTVESRSRSKVKSRGITGVKVAYSRLAGFASFASTNELEAPTKQRDQLQRVPYHRLYFQPPAPRFPAIFRVLPLALFSFSFMSADTFDFFSAFKSFWLLSNFSTTSDCPDFLFVFYSFHSFFANYPIDPSNVY